MSKKSKTILMIVMLILGLIIVYGVSKFFVRFFDVFERAKTITKEYALTEKEIILLDKFGTQETIKFNDSTTYLLHFWATWCKPCISEFDTIEKYQKSWKNVEIVLITLESNEKMNSFLKNTHWDLPFYSIDSLSLPFNPKKIEFYPSNFIVKNDSLIDISFGPVEWQNAFKTGK